jgi:glycerol-3-phosphate acyltransferase PlsX
MLFVLPVASMQADKSLHQNLKKSSSITIGIDLMGSDRSPEHLFNAVILASKALGSGCKLLAFLSQDAWNLLSDDQKKFNDPACASIAFHFADQVIEMGDEPLLALRQKKNASLVVGLRQLKKKNIDAFVSLGNTGALIAGATLNLPLLPGIRRPALLATLPAAIGRISILDVGGNVSSKAADLIRFGIMGACFERVHFGIDVPEVGLLNVGSESKKGTSEHRLAYTLLSELKTPYLKFIGNVEGSEVFQGKAQVIVTDGFTGNVLLKSAEGIATYIIEFLKQKNSAEVKALETRFSSDEHPGAIVLGVEGVVVKCHGGSSATALFNGIKAAASYVQKGLIQKMKDELLELSNHPQ